MGLSEEEAEEIKQKLISHIESTFPAEQVASARSQVESMNSEQLEDFLERNQLIKDSNNAGKECVFCSIANNKIKSVAIEENEKAIAVLEINPLSRGHTIIIPKEHSEKIQKQVLSFAEKISKKIKEKFMPKKVEISESRLFGHGIINLLPVYGNEDFNSEKKPAKLEELERVKEELEEIKEPEKISKPKTEKIKGFLWLPKRIP